MNKHVTPPMHGNCYNLFLCGMRLSRQGNAPSAMFPWSYLVVGSGKSASIYTTVLFGVDFFGIGSDRRHRQS
jgi:hypothetical protein